MGLIEKGGAWLTYGEYKWQGREKAKLALQKDISMRDALEKQLRLIITGEVVDEPVEAKSEIVVDGEEVNDKPPRKKRSGKSADSTA
jgi:hypothetical protein